MSMAQTGVVLARVTDAADPETLGRVRVEYLSLSEGVESDWAPVAAPMAGAEAGFFTMPEPGDMAVIAFQQGDVNRPVVLGYLWTGDQAPPAQEPTERRWVSRNGHAITLSDGDDDGIILADKHGNTITMNKDGITIDCAGVLRITAQSTIDGEASGAMTLKGNPIELNP